MRNDALAAAIRATDLTAETLARAAAVAPKTVRRWLADDTVVPHPETRARVEKLLAVSAGQLWPNGTVDDAQSQPELVTLYPARSAVPSALIGTLMAEATTRIDILAISAAYLWETVDGLLPTLAARAAAGVAVRILLADPDGEAVAVRGEEDGMGELVRARAQIAWALLRPLAGVPGIEMCMHDTTLYAAVLRADDNLLVNPHVFGLPASVAPVMHLRGRERGRVAQTYLMSLERVADLARTTGIDTATGQPRRLSRPRVLRPVSQSGGA
jgi:hypothetical protein